jgi:predicted glutamine amidotransferase
MCIAVFKPQDVKIKKAVLKHCFEQNPDGCGFAIPCLTGKTMKIRKGFFTFRSFWEQYREHESRGTPMLIHFRIATSGKIDQDNCHPWRISDKHALIHNGVLEHKLGLCHDDVSDTGLFVANILKPIFEQSTELWLNPAFKWTVEESIGNNKLVLLDNAGNHVIYNESKGEWHEGAWFSNATYKEERKKRTTGTIYNTTTATGVAFQGNQQQLLLPPPREKDLAEGVTIPEVKKQDEVLDPTTIC